jgi:dissimilatory sulfite reductase related protein
MATRTIAGTTVQVNDEGFMTNPAEWTREMAPALAQEEGIAELTPAHWKVIDFSRDTAKTLGGKSPTLRQITTGTGVSTKDLFALFPKGPAKKVAKIAGLGKPEGCV